MPTTYVGERYKFAMIELGKEVINNHSFSDVLAERYRNTRDIIGITAMDKNIDTIIVITIMRSTTLDVVKLRNYLEELKETIDKPMLPTTLRRKYTTEEYSRAIEFKVRIYNHMILHKHTTS